MKYSVILMDPPWFYNDRKLIRKDGKVPKAGPGAGNHYPCMKNSELAALPIFNIMEENCAVFMWTTGPHLRSPFEVVFSWNQQEALKKRQLRYTNKAFCWQKITKNGLPFAGRGHWNFHNTEDCLLFMRGTLEVQKTVFEEIREAHERDLSRKIIHARKPQATRERIEQMFGDLSRIELFATERNPGWSWTGYDVDGLDIKNFLEAYGDKEVAWKIQSGYGEALCSALPS